MGLLGNALKGFTERRSQKYSKSVDASVNLNKSASSAASSSGGFFSRVKQTLKKFTKKQDYDDSVDLSVVSSPKYSRGSSRVSFAGDIEDSEDELEGSESEEEVDEPPVLDPLNADQEDSYEALSDAGSVDLMDLVHEVHPQILKMPTDQLKMEREIKSKLHPMRKYNMMLMRGPERIVKPNQGPRPVPRLLVVAGHNSDIGNRNINGVYEKMPGSYNGRPWYRKTVQRMPDRVADASMGPASRKLPKVPGYINPMGINEGDFEEPSIAQVGPARNQISKTLYFDDRHGQWKIGSNPKDPKCFARCSDPGADVPHRLRNWQVWDVKTGEWFFHPSMYCERGGG